METVKIHCLIPHMGKVGQSGEGDVKKASPSTKHSLYCVFLLQQYERDYCDTNPFRFPFKK